MTSAQLSQGRYKYSPRARGSLSVEFTRLFAPCPALPVLPTLLPSYLPTHTLSSITIMPPKKSSTGKSKAPRAVWNSDRDGLLIAGFEVEKMNGYQAESGWKKASLERVALYIERSDPTASFNTDQVRDRYAAVSTTHAHLLSVNSPQNPAQEGLEGYQYPSGSLWLWLERRDTHSYCYRRCLGRSPRGACY
jgi:hypothetical protein